MKRKIIIDTDPGQDDALAILLALASPEELDVLGIVTVAGNVPLPLTTRNARALVELANSPEVPVFAGCPRPLMLMVKRGWMAGICLHPVSHCRVNTEWIG